MADFTFDIGGCHPRLQPVTEVQRGIGTPVGVPFIVGRRVYERGWKRAELSWAAADFGIVYGLQDWWAKTSGGVLTMDYTPDNGETAYEIRFDPTLPIEWQQLSAVLYSVTAFFWQRIDQ